VSRITITQRGSAAADAAVSGPEELRRGMARPVPRRPWWAVFQRSFWAGNGIWLEPAGPVTGELRGGWVAGPVLAAAVAAFAAAQYAIGRPVAAAAWLAIAPLLGSLALRPVRTTLLALWTVLLGLGLALEARGPAGRLASSLAVLVLLSGFAVANSVLRCAAQRRLGQARAVARVAQSALLREVPRSVAAAQFASRYLSASAEAQVGGDVIEVIADGANPRWLVGDTRGKGLPAVRLASVAATSFRDACAEPGLSLTEIARSVDLSVTRAAGEEDFVTGVFAELDPRGWIQLVNCGHPAPLRLSTDGELMPLNPAAFAAPLGLHPDLRVSTFSVRTGDRLVFFTDGLLEARDRAGRFFRLDQQIETLRRPDLQAAADELLDRLRAHTRHRLDDDVAVLLAELTLTDPASHQSAAAGQQPAAALCPGRPGGGGVPDGEQAIPHDRDPLGPPGHRGVVGDDDEREATLAPQLFQERHNLVARTFVEVAGGLVREEHSWSLDQGPRDSNPLLLAARQLGRQMPGPLVQPDLSQRLPGALLPVPSVRVERDQRGLDVLLSGQGGDEVEGLEDEADRGGADLGELAFPQAGQVLAVQFHGARGRAVKGAEDLQQGALAVTRRPLDRQPVAVLDDHIHAPQCVHDSAALR
jgi:sigma-B regulation protein RsbU (phosphoserine phosphatase)